jgi:hypothetical protein
LFVIFVVSTWFNKKKADLTHVDKTRSQKLLTSAIETWHVWSIGGMILTRKTKLLRGNCIPLILYFPQIPQGLAWDSTRPSMVRGHHLVTCIIVWPITGLCYRL